MYFLNLIVTFRLKIPQIFNFVLFDVQLFKGIASEAEKLLDDLQNILYSEESKLSAFAQQQREVRFYELAYNKLDCNIRINVYNIF